MIRHLLRLTWNRKRSSALVALEIFASFLVLFIVVTLGIWSLHLYRQPLGYSYANVWNVTMELGETGGDASEGGEEERLGRLLQELRSIDKVEKVAAAFNVPYDHSTSQSSHDVNGRQIEFESSSVSEGYAEVLGIKPIAGRWFEPADLALAHESVVINASLAHDLFGDESAVGREFPKFSEGHETRIIGVIEAFRKNGELSIPVNFLFHLRKPHDPNGWSMRNLILRVSPTAGIATEQEILARARAIAPTWSCELRRLEDARTESFQLTLAPLAVGALIGAFLLLMAGLGLLGVLWQNVARRTRELGLRRAAGASATDVRRLILLEVVVITSISILPGAILIAQLPLLGVTAYVPAGVIAVGAVSAAALIYLLTFLCGYYPSWMATLIEPAEALRAE